MNRLKFNRCYLAGPIESTTDGGQDWRIEIQKELADLEILFLDPTCKPTTVGIETEETKHILQGLREKGDFKLLKQMMMPIRSYDLRMVDIADFLIVHLDNRLATCGTWEEIFTANKQKKPILVHMQQGKKAISHWLFATLPEQMMFGEWAEIHKYVRHIACDKAVDDLNRWRFFDFSLGRKF